MSKKGKIALLIILILACINTVVVIVLVSILKNGNNGESNNNTVPTAELSLPSDETSNDQDEKVVNKYTVVWKNYDGEILETDTDVVEGTMPHYDGDTPTKPSTAQYTYTYSSWDKNLSEVTGDIEYIALYSEEVNKYTVVWKNYDGEILETDTDVLYGTMPHYDGDIPVKPSTAQYTYTYATWDKNLSEVTGDIEYIALYSEEVNKYTVLWKNYDGTVLETDTNVSYGTMPHYNGDIPIKTKSNDYYSFVGWNTVVSSVIGDIEYVATFEETPIPYYTIRFKNYDGDVLSTIEVKEGEMPEYNGTPTRPKDDNYTYEFNGWLPEIKVATENVDYVAQFESEDLPYSVIIDLDGGSSQSTKLNYKVENAGEIVLPFDVTKTSYKFKGYELENVQVYDENGNEVNNYILSSNMVFKAIYEESIVLTINSSLYNPETGKLIITYSECDNALGVVTGAGVYTHNKTVPISVTSNTGYTFIGWYNNNNQQIDTDSSCDIMMWQDDLTIEARFEYTMHDLTVSTYNSTLGTVTIKTDSGQTFKDTQTESIYNTKLVTIAANSKTEHEFLGWYLDNNFVSSDSIYTFEMPNNDYSLVAKWDYFNISYILDDGINNENNPNYYTSSSNITLLPPTKNGYTFVKWQYNSLPITEIDSSLLIDIELTAIWTYYTLTTEIDNSDAGSATLYTNEKITSGEKVTLIATTNPGYTFEGWYEGTSLVTTDPSYTFDMPANNLSYTAKWTINTDTPYKVEHYLQNINDNGYPNVPADTDNLTGTTATMTNALTKSYTGFTALSVTQKVIKGDGTTVVKLYYTRNSYILTLKKNYSAGGTVTGAGTYKYEKEVTITATENTDYEWLGWYKDNVEVTKLKTYTFTIGASDEVFEARWKQDELAIFNYTKFGDNIILHSVKDKTLTEIVIPDCVTSIDEGALSGCSNLEKLSIPFIGDMNREYGDSDIKTFGYIFGKTSYLGSYEAGVYYIPKKLYDVTITGGSCIPQWCFQSCKSLLTITIPSTVTTISNTYTTFPSNDKLVEIYNLSNCNIMTDLFSRDFKKIHTSIDEKSIIVKDSKGYIFSYYYGKAVLEGYVGNDTILELPTEFNYDGNTITEYSLGRYAFSENSSITNVIVPNNLTAVGDAAFNDCTSLNYNSYDNAYYIGSSVNPYLILIKAKNEDITSCNIHSDCKFIYGHAFMNCKLTNIIIPEGVKIIGLEAFSMSSISSVVLPSTLIKISELAFYSCNLTSVNIPSGVTEILWGAFYRCGNLSYIYIPKTVTNLNNYIFMECTSLTTINYEGTIAEWNAIVYNDGWRELSSITTVSCSDGDIQYNS